MPILKRWKIGESVLSCDEERWRIRMDFQEGKFMFENWKDVYAVLFTTRVRKNGSSGLPIRNDASRIAALLDWHLYKFS